MPLLRSTTHFGVDEAALYPLTADVTTNPTYGAKVPLPFITSFSPGFDILHKEAFGDGAVRALATRVRKATVSMVATKVNLDAIPTLLGGTNTDTGTTPNMTLEYLLKGADRGKYFKIMFRQKELDNGEDLHWSFFKCKLSAITEDQGAEDYNTFNITVSAIATVSNDNVYSRKYHETATALPA